MTATQNVTFEFPGFKVVLQMHVFTRSAAVAHEPFGQLTGRLSEIIMALRCLDNAQRCRLHPTHAEAVCIAPDSGKTLPKVSKNTKILKM